MIIELGRESGIRMRHLNTEGAHMIKFSAETKCSGINLKDGTEIRKGAFDAIGKISQAAGKPFPKERKTSSVQLPATEELLWSLVSIEEIAGGLIELQDIIKPGIQERLNACVKWG